MIYFTTSWDDGAKEDVRLAELLLRYQLKGTFYIPLANVEKREVLSKTEINIIANDFEIAAHTVNHKYLTTISNEEAQYEIESSKKKLEDIINKSVDGFCFPGGKYNNTHIKLVKEAGFKYARTINMFQDRVNSTLMDTSLQAFNHSKSTYLKHLIKRGYFNSLYNYGIQIFSNNKWDGLLEDMITKAVKNDSSKKIKVIHLWGHSWEINQYNSWQQLEHFFKYISSQKIEFKTNHEAFNLNYNFYLKG
jgi:peptidoglycan/xylan/chitin deacetylase (PgdA/CDA1 family)